MGHLFIANRHKISALILGGLAMCLTATNIPQAATAAQTTPAVTYNAPLARDAATFESDKTLNLACRESRNSNSPTTRETCLCVTHILKYELTLPQYRAAVQLYGVEGRRNDIYKSLKQRGVSTSDMQAAEQIERTLLGAPDFAPRCAVAKAYYR